MGPKDILSTPMIFFSFTFRSFDRVGVAPVSQAVPEAPLIPAVLVSTEPENTLRATTLASRVVVLVSTEPEKTFNASTLASRVVVLVSTEPEKTLRATTLASREPPPPPPQLLELS